MISDYYKKQVLLFIYSQNSVSTDELKKHFKRVPLRTMEKEDLTITYNDDLGWSLTEDGLDVVNEEVSKDAGAVLKSAVMASLDAYRLEAEHQDGYGYWSEHFRKPDGTWDVDGMMRDFWMVLGHDLDIAFEVKGNIDPDATDPPFTKPEENKST